MKNKFQFIKVIISCVKNQKLKYSFSFKSGPDSIDTK